MGGHGADDAGMVALGRHPGVGRPAVGPGGCGRCDVGVDEGVEAAEVGPGLIVEDLSEALPAEFTASLKDLGLAIGRENLRPLYRARAKKAAEAGEALAEEMSRAQIAKAQWLTREWNPKK